jgi:ribosomal 50S subunit-recycling heat shock protein
MRIDLVLKYLCLVKSRSVAKSLCERDRILVNDKPARSSAPVRAGDRVTVRFLNRALTLEIESVPEKQLSKSNAPAYYRLIRTTEERDDPLADL